MSPCKMRRWMRRLLQRARGSVGRGSGGTRGHLRRGVAATALLDEGLLRHSLCPAHPLGSPFGEARLFGLLTGVGPVLSDDDRQEQRDDRNDEQQERLKHLGCPIFRSCRSSGAPSGGAYALSDPQGQRAPARNVSVRRRISLPEGLTTCASCPPIEAA